MDCTITYTFQWVPGLGEPSDPPSVAYIVEHPFASIGITSNFSAITEHYIDLSVPYTTRMEIGTYAFSEVARGEPQIITEVENPGTTITFSRNVYAKLRCAGSWDGSVGDLSRTAITGSVDLRAQVQTDPPVREYINIPIWTVIVYDPNNPVFSPGSGGANGGGDPVSLITGEHMDFPDSDISAYNPFGPNAIFQRNNYSGMAKSSYGSPGLPAGWVHNYDLRIITTGDNNAWSDLVMLYPNCAQDKLVVNGTAGEITAPAGAPYMVTGTQSTIGKWTSINVRWKQGDTVWTFVPKSEISSVYTLKKIANRMGRYIEINRDSNDRVTTVTDDSATPNTLLTFAYNTDGYVSSVTDCHSRKVVYTYGNATDENISDKCLLEVSQIVKSTATTAPFQLKYDYVSRFSGKPFLSTTKTPSPTGTGTSTITAAYDTDANNARVLSLTDPNGVVREYSYGWDKTRITVKKDGVTAMYWDQKFDPVKYVNTGTTDSKNHSTTIEYNDSNNPYSPTKITDKNGKETTITYDQTHKYGNIVSITNPRGTTTTYDYSYANSPFGWLTRAVQGTKTLATIGYYSSGLVQTITAPKPGTTNGSTVASSYTYDALGNILTVTTPGNGTVTSIVTTLNYTTDGSFSQAAMLGQPLTVTDNLGHVTHLRYDAMGNVISATDALGREVNYTYNIVGQPVLAISPKPPAP
ncbi:MAG: hypothetical protein ABFD64_10645 [Armatimonadota bacterium]